MGMLLWAATAALCALLPNVAVRGSAARPPEQLSWSEALGVHLDGVPLQKTWLFRRNRDRSDSVVGAALPREYTVSYIEAGNEDDPPLLLIHGFGASSFHWRSNVNALAQAGNRVFAIDLLGFGASDKPLLDYDSDLWVTQCASFLREVAACGLVKDGDGRTSVRRAVVAGNSIGGLTALALAASEPSLVRGIASLNGAGRFSPTPAERVQSQRRKGARGAPSPLTGFSTAWSGTVDTVGAALRKILLSGAFVLTKQPARIAQVRSFKQSLVTESEVIHQRKLAIFETATEKRVGCVLQPPHAPMFPLLVTTHLLHDNSRRAGVAAGVSSQARACGRRLDRVNRMAR